MSRGHQRKCSRSGMRDVVAPFQLREHLRASANTIRNARAIGDAIGSRSYRRCC